MRQARNVHLLRETINVKDTQIGKLREDNAKLRRMLKVSDKWHGMRGSRKNCQRGSNLFLPFYLFFYIVF